MIDCKRLIEVDMPIKIISEYARHDQNVKKGHLHSMHVWWATRPLAACRAAILATLLPDPCDPNCPDKFKNKAKEILRPLGERESVHDLELRKALLDFIANFSKWENSVNTEMISKARALVNSVYPDVKPLVVDPFAGIGSIPFEALRVGADAFASDLNPVAVLLLKTALEYIPLYGERLAEAVKRWGAWVREKASVEMKDIYPIEPDGSIPLAYLWARVIRCEGPNCGAEVPLVGLLWLSHKEKQRVALRYFGDKATKQVKFEIYQPRSGSDIQSPIVRRFAATCPICGYTTPYNRVREQIRAKGGGARDARMIAIITLKPDGRRDFRLANWQDMEVAQRACQALERLRHEHNGILPLVPNEQFPAWYSGVFNTGLWNIKTWGDLFTPRQALALVTFTRIVREAHQEVLKETGDAAFARAVVTCIGTVVSNLAPYLCSVSYYGQDHQRTAFLNNGLPMRPDFAEANPTIPYLVGGLDYCLSQLISVLEHEGAQKYSIGTAQQCSATTLPLPDQSVPYVVTDPPYYAAIPYSDLSDFCYVWLKRMLAELYPDLFRWSLTPKDDEIIAYYVQPPDREQKNGRFFERKMKEALAECKRVLKPDGVAVVLFAHKGTAGWEALLNALIQVGWSVTSSWPIETERAARMRAKSSAVLASSVFLVCRPRLPDAGIGNWRDILAELQPRVHGWMQRLVKEDIVGADAIFSCIGPALEIFSRYERVETAAGKEVTLKEYLEHVWAAVGREALNTIVQQCIAGADPQGFEEDARLTAMWLWTLRTSRMIETEQKSIEGTEKAESEEEEEETETKKRPKGFALEYDAVRKIAQGLGARLEDFGKPGGIVEIKGKIARLLLVAERRRVLLGRAKEAPRRRKRRKQLTLFEEGVPEELELPTAIETGRTILDRLHQAMLLFADGNLGALKHFLVDEGVGRDDRFWRLAQALSALYPMGVEEKRWVDGVLARKKGLGL